MSEERLRPLAGKTAIVTGGSSGIGRATCMALARAGAQLVAVGTHPGRLQETLSALNGIAPGAGHLAMQLDVRSEPDMVAMARRTLERFGRIDILVASAAILRVPGILPKPLAETTIDEWDRVIDTNLRGMFLSNRAVLAPMIAQGGGEIVNISSVSGKEGRPHDGPYCASKFAVIGLSQSLAAEVRGQGIRVQVVLPDATDTPIWEQNKPVPMPSNAIPAERVADLIVFLITQPRDAVLGQQVIAPFLIRRRVVPRGSTRV
jgi:NAD(P)-dependent dehydrogenase (short-subunit alcohol dehydrogenase family)